MKENVTMQIIRSSILGILWSIALILLCGEPIEDETWFRVFFITKGLAFFVDISHTNYLYGGNQKAYCPIWTMIFNG